MHNYDFSGKSFGCFAGILYDTTLQKSFYLPIFWPKPAFPLLAAGPRPLPLFWAACGKSTLTTRRLFFGNFARACVCE